MYAFLGFSFTVWAAASDLESIGAVPSVFETPFQIVVRLFAIGALTGALALLVFAAYAILAPRIRRYVSSLRMRRVRRSHRSPSNGGSSS